MYCFFLSINFDIYRRCFYFKDSLCFHWLKKSYCPCFQQHLDFHNLLGLKRKLGYCYINYGKILLNIPFNIEKRLCFIPPPPLFVHILAEKNKGKSYFIQTERPHFANLYFYIPHIIDSYQT